MSEEHPETPTMAVRVYIAGIALACAFRAVEHYEWPWTADAAISAGLSAMLTIGDWKLPKILKGVEPGAAHKLNTIASDPRWWILSILLYLFIGTLSPFIEEHRWPYSLASVPLDIGTPTQHPVPELTEATLKAAMAADFPGTWQNNADYKLKIDGEDKTVRVTDFRDPHTGAEFLGVFIPFIPNTDATVTIATDIITNHRKLLTAIGKGGILTRAHGQDGEESANDVVFTNRLYMYYDTTLLIEKRAELQKMAKSIGLTLILRGPEYIVTEKWKIPDAHRSAR